jgi:ribose transport system permease protein
VDDVQRVPEHQTVGITESHAAEPPEGASDAARTSEDHPHHHGRQGQYIAKYGLVGLLAAELLVFSLTIPHLFATWANFQNMLSSQSITLVLTLGLSIPVLAGEIDASVAGTMGTTMVFFGFFSVLHHWPFALALIVCLLMGALIGCFNAFLVVGLGINSFIATIGTGTALGGIQILLSNSQLIPNLPHALTRVASSSWFGLPAVVYYAIGLAVILWIVYEHMPVGRRLTFVGVGREAAHLAGVRVAYLRAGSFIASGTIAGVAGLLLAGQLGTADPAAGATYLLPAFAGVFLGSTVIKPGRPNSWGIVVAVYVLVVGVTGLQLIGVGSWLTDVFNGCALIIGVGVTRLASRRGSSDYAI